MKYISENEKHDGRYGEGVEMALKAYFRLKINVSKPGRTDMRKANVCYEIKTGAGELGDVGHKLVKGCSMVVYVPVVNENLPIEEQEGFVMEREVFLEILEECGLIREKTSTSGVRKVTIQTFWNRSKNAPHGKGYRRMLDAFYNNESVTPLDIWLEQFLDD